MPRQLIKREEGREQEEKLLAMFSEAAVHVTDEDLDERESLLGGFSGEGSDRRLKTIPSG